MSIWRSMYKLRILYILMNKERLDSTFGFLKNRGAIGVRIRINTPDKPFDEVEELTCSLWVFVGFPIPPQAIQEAYQENQRGLRRNRFHLVRYTKDLIGNDLYVEHLYKEFGQHLLENLKKLFCPKLKKINLTVSYKTATEQGVVEGKE